MENQERLFSYGSWCIPIRCLW